MPHDPKNVASSVSNSTFCNKSFCLGNLLKIRLHGWRCAFQTASSSASHLSRISAASFREILFLVQGFLWQRDI